MGSKGTTYDVAVIGGGTAGWIAALSAAREGSQVLLIERKGYCGGVLGSGLAIYGFHDVNHRQIVKGYADEFVEVMSACGGSAGYVLLDMWHASMVPVDPALVKPVILTMLHDAGVDLLLYSQLVGARVEGRRITSLNVRQKSESITVEADVIIDASGDAVVPLVADLPWEHTHDQQPPSLVLRLEYVDIKELREYLKKNPEHFVTWRMMPGKEVNNRFLDQCQKFMILPELIDAFPYVGEYAPLIDRVMFTCLPGCTAVAINMLRAHEVDGTDSAALTRATVDIYRNVIPLVDFFRRTIPGFSRCKLVDGEPEIQLRETRRIVGETRIETDHVVEGRIPEDAIALGGYYIDIHSSKDSGGDWRMPGGPYGIPYGAIVAADADNLFAAGRIISGSREAAGSYRVMATCMAVGQAAGIAASVAAAESIPAATLSIDRLRERLRETGAVVE